MPLAMFNVSDYQHAVFRRVVSNVEINRVETTIAPDIQENPLKQEARISMVGPVLGSKTKLIGYVGDFLFNESINGFFRSRGKRKIVVVRMFGFIAEMNVESHRRTLRARGYRRENGLVFPEAYASPAASMRSQSTGRGGSEAWDRASARSVRKA
jgi:hypothetical protein